MRGLSGWSPANPATVVSAGGAWRFWSPPYPAVAVPGGAACLLCRLLPPCPQLAFLPPIPPSPRSQSALPRRGRGRPRLFHARGFAPCIPATEPARHWLDLPIRHPAGGTAVLFAGLLCLCGSPAGGTMVLVAGRFFALAVFLPPSPRPPSRREGGRILLYFAGGFAPGTPALNRLRHLQSLPSRCPAQRGVRGSPRNR